jgi:hypothetical protein
MPLALPAAYRFSRRLAFDRAHAMPFKSFFACPYPERLNSLEGMRHASKSNAQAPRF